MGPLAEWRREWRRRGENMMGGAFVLAIGWVTAARTFVAESNGRVIHPSAWGWPLLVIGVMFVVGTYCFVASYWSRLWLPGKRSTVQAEKRQQWQDTRDRLNPRLTSTPVTRVELVNREPARLEAPVAYQVDQIEQVLPKIAETMQDFDVQVLDVVLARSPRTNRDDVYEPLRGWDVREGLAALVERGVLSPGDRPYSWRIIGAR